MLRRYSHEATCLVCGEWSAGRVGTRPACSADAAATTEVEESGVEAAARRDARQQRQRHQRQRSSGTSGGPVDGGPPTDGTPATAGFGRGRPVPPIRTRSPAARPSARPRGAAGNSFCCIRGDGGQSCVTGAAAVPGHRRHSPRDATKTLTGPGGESCCLGAGGNGIRAQCDNAWDGTQVAPLQDQRECGDAGDAGCGDHVLRRDEEVPRLQQAHRLQLTSSR